MELKTAGLFDRNLVRCKPPLSKSCLTYETKDMVTSSVEQDFDKSSTYIHPFTVCITCSVAPVALSIGVLSNVKVAQLGEQVAPNRKTFIL